MATKPAKAAKVKPKRPRKPKPIKFSGWFLDYCTSAVLLLNQQDPQARKLITRLRDWLTRWLEWQEGQR